MEDISGEVFQENFNFDEVSSLSLMTASEPDVKPGLWGFQSGGKKPACSVSEPLKWQELVWHTVA